MQYCNIITNENFKIVEREYPSLEWAEWETWSSCSKSCGDGIQTRKRTIENPELIYEHQETSYVPFGLECDAEEDKKCNLEPCPGKIFFSTKLSQSYLEKPPGLYPNLKNVLTNIPKFMISSCKAHFKCHGDT